jgi:hypothetical protein
MHGRVAGTVSASEGAHQVAARFPVNSLNDSFKHGLDAAHRY